jgi:LAO/AO transport system kinase
MGPERLFEAARAGERPALARLISQVEAGAPGVGAFLAGLEPRRRGAPGSPHVVGITGPPGAGKSTFTSLLVRAARERGQRVAVVAVDPSSPRSGGAILGDRIRMEAHAGDEGVWVRSLSARGHGGGLSRATGHVVDVLDAVGFDHVLVETVGVGQGELAVIEVADTAVVVLTPESGDTVQTMKAGLLEVADVFVVNKADRAGAEHLQRDLELSVHLDGRDWEAPVHTTVALDGRGLAEVVASIGAHRGWIVGAGRASWEARRAEGRRSVFLDLVGEAARRRAVVWLAGEGRAAALSRGDARAEALAAAFVATGDDAGAGRPPASSAGPRG